VKVGGEENVVEIAD